MIRATASWPLCTTGRSATVPSARMAACPGMMIEAMASTPYIPRLETVKLPPEISSGVREPCRAFSASVDRRSCQFPHIFYLGLPDDRHL